MNRRIVLFILGKMLKMEGVILLLPMLISIIYNEKGTLSFFFTSIILFIIGQLMTSKKPYNKDIYAKEGFVIVALTWILWSAFGALPFYFSGSIPSYIDALFETISGFTTTGSTILENIEILSRGILFWRNFTHWLGGMGVLVFVLAVMPLSDKRSMHLMRAEVPGPTVGKLEPKIRSTAKALYGMYIALTLVLIILLLFGGMDLYDSIIHAFSTAGTGGFSNRNASISYYNSSYIDGVITIFMILFGINFNVFYFLFIKRMIGIIKNEELLVYLGIIGTAILSITFNIINLYGSFFKAFRYASFQVASIITTTGFYTANYDRWPEFSKTILLLVMFCGACAGSTGGGIKISRIIILFKLMKQEIHHMLHPRSITVIKMDNRMMESDTIRGVLIYMVAYVFILAFSVLVISKDNFDFATNFSGVLTMLNNVGPGISLVGPVENFYNFSWLSKIVFCVDMLVGRLEIFPMLIIFSPSLWRRKF